MKRESPTPNAQRPPPREGEVDGPVYDLEERLLDYAARIIRLCDSLPTSRAGNHIAGQLLRSGSAALPNHGEAEAAESRDDFLHKLRICLKELRESRRWLLLIGRSGLIKPPSKLDPIVEETEQLIRIFFASIRTANSRPENGERISEDARPQITWALGVERWALGVDPSPPEAERAEAAPKRRPRK